MNYDIIFCYHIAKLTVCMVYYTVGQKGEDGVPGVPGLPGINLLLINCYLYDSLINV